MLCRDNTKSATLSESADLSESAAPSQAAVAVKSGLSGNCACIMVCITRQARRGEEDFTECLPAKPKFKPRRGRQRIRRPRGPSGVFSDVSACQWNSGIDWTLLARHGGRAEHVSNYQIDGSFKPQNRGDRVVLAKLFLFLFFKKNSWRQVAQAKRARLGRQGAHPDGFGS